LKILIPILWVPPNFDFSTKSNNYQWRNGFKIFSCDYPQKIEMLFRHSCLLWQLSLYLHYIINECNIFSNVKVKKGKYVPVKHNAIKMYGIWRYSSPFLTLALDDGEWSASCPGCFNSGEKPPYPLDSKLSGPQSWSGHCGVEKMFLPLSGIIS
jgi:hypothetical protein